MIKSPLKKPLGKENTLNVNFKQEPCILHIACLNLGDAKRILDKARLAGWKKSGMISCGKRFVVEANSTERLEFPIIKNGKLLVDWDFLKIIVKEANENLEKSWKRIGRLEKMMD